MRFGEMIGVVLVFIYANFDWKEINICLQCVQVGETIVVIHVLVGAEFG